LAIGLVTTALARPASTSATAWSIEAMAAAALVASGCPGAAVAGTASGTTGSACMNAAAAASGVVTVIGIDRPSTRARRSSASGSAVT
jgi:hypothetical protein